MSVKRELKIVNQAVEVIVGGSCDHCGAEFRPVHVDEAGSWHGFVHALTITLHGGYAEYFDGPSGNVYLCNVCADVLIKAFPAFSGAMEEYALMGLPLGEADSTHDKTE